MFFKFLNRVAASNEVGLGEFCELMKDVTASDILEEPRLDFSDNTQNTVRVKAGSPVNLSLGISGSPQPDIKWKKDDDSLPSRCNISVTDKNTSVNIDVSNRFLKKIQLIIISIFIIMYLERMLGNIQLQQKMLRARNHEQLMLL